MMTRSLEPRTRLLALETVAQVRRASTAPTAPCQRQPCPARLTCPCLPCPSSVQLVGRLSEEYLALLPETLPFLAELLEDAELAVEAGAQALVRQLETLSGEPLDQYLC